MRIHMHLAVTSSYLQVAVKVDKPYPYRIHVNVHLKALSNAKQLIAG